MTDGVDALLTFLLERIKEDHDYAERMSIGALASHRHDPDDRERLLADAEMKRRLVIGIGRSGCVRMNSVGQLTSPQTQGLAVTVLAEIAQVYKNHRDFHDEWLIPDDAPPAQPEVIKPGRRFLRSRVRE